jgi:transcriptional regulator with XRE-family HTH domain
MKNTTKAPFKNQLATIRESKRMEQKQIAALLGHRGTKQISSYEQGVKNPDLKTALKLAQIYKIPIRIMLDGYFDACREEVRRQEERLSKAEGSRNTATDQFLEFDFCSYEQVLAKERLGEDDIFKVRKHSTYLVRKTGERLGHI